jgi:hypothetical protein
MPKKKQDEPITDLIVDPIPKVTAPKSAPVAPGFARFRAAPGVLGTSIEGASYRVAPDGTIDLPLGNATLAPLIGVFYFPQE